MLQTNSLRQVESRSIIQSGLDEDRQMPELYLRALVDSHSAGTAVLNEFGRILYVNRAWRKFAVRHGFRPELYGVGCNYLEVRRSGDDARAEESVALATGVSNVLVGKETEFQQEYLTCNSVDRRWVRIHAGRFDLPYATRVLVTHEDITESIQVAKSHLKAAENLQRLLDATHILPWEIDFESSLFTFVGEQAVAMLGYPTEAWYQPEFWINHLHPDDRNHVVAQVANYIKTRENYEVEYRMVAKDGRVVWLHNVVIVSREDGLPKTVRGFSIDITESKLKEAALSELSGRLINAQEEERRRIARELHDDLNQQMALLSIELEQLGQNITKRAETRKRLENLQSKVQEISADIHRLSYKLHPSKLDHLGLAAALKSLCQEICDGGKLEVELQQIGFPTTLPKDVTLCIFRIAQESLRNCVKHSDAKLARVVLKKTDEQVLLSIADDGRGLDMESGVMNKGLGFTSMLERLRIVNGKIEIHSKPMQGTRLDVSVPLALRTEHIENDHHSP
jgi:PAS domain S-box-containing protein